MVSNASKLALLAAGGYALTRIGSGEKAQANMTTELSPEGSYFEVSTPEEIGQAESVEWTITDPSGGTHKFPGNQVGADIPVQSGEYKITVLIRGEDGDVARVNKTLTIPKLPEGM